MCDTLCFRTATGMVFAKNSDRPPSEIQVLLAHTARSAGGMLDTQYLRIPDPGAFAFVGSHPTWLWGAEHGLNEHGVAIGNEKIWTVDDPHASPPALIGMDLVRLGLERGRTAAGALDAITDALGEHGQGGSGEPAADEPYFSSFLIADASCGYVVETSARSWVAREVGDGASISNRVSMSTDWTAASPDIARGTNFDDWRAPTVPTAIADHRLASTAACVTRHAAGSGASPVADVVATLRDHGLGAWGAPGTASHAVSPLPDAGAADFRGVTVCMHIPGYQATTASIVVDLPTGAPARAWACLGSPCVGVYVPFFPPHVPPFLTDPAQWQRFARLRDRVEADPAALTPARETLGPLERDLWSEADALASRRDPADLERFAAGVPARVGAALAALSV